MSLILPTAYRREMERQHRESGATELFWPVPTGWSARIEGASVVVASPDGEEWRWPIEGGR